MTNQTADFKTGDIVRINEQAATNLIGVLGTITDTNLSEESHDFDGALIHELAFCDGSGSETTVALWDFKLDLIARPEVPALDAYREGDEFPNVGYVRRLTGQDRVEKRAA